MPLPANAIAKSLHGWSGHYRCWDPNGPGRSTSDIISINNVGSNQIFNRSDDWTLYLATYVCYPNIPHWNFVKWMQARLQRKVDPQTQQEFRKPGYCLTGHTSCRLATQSFDDTVTRAFPTAIPYKVCNVKCQKNGNVPTSVTVFGDCINAMQLD